MRRFLALVFGLLALSGTAALGQSPPPITVSVFPKVTPNKAGTAAHPQGVHLDVRIKIGISENYEPPLVQTIDVWFPRGGVYNGDSYPTCSKSTLDALGPGACTKDSIMGYGGGVARADTTFSYPQITVVNGGRQEVFFYTVLNNPARVQEPVVGQITRLTGPWSYKLHIIIPKNLQVVAGVPLVLQSLHVAAGRGDWLATTYCPPSRKWAYHAVASFDTGQTVTTNGTVACRP
jgi:hypothetical protein